MIVLLTAVVTNVSRAQVENGVSCAQILRLAINHRHQPDGSHLLLLLLLIMKMMLLLLLVVVVVMVERNPSLDFDAT